MSVGAGFPNAAEDAGDEPLNLHRLIVKSPASTFFMRVDTSNHVEMGIHPRDILVVDRSLEMRSGDLVVFHNGGDFLIKRYYNRGGKPTLVGSPKEKPIEFNDDLVVWGVVSHTVHDFRGDYALEL